MSSLIAINNYKKRFEEYPADLVAFAKENKIQLCPLTSMRGQALALMAQPEVRGQKYLGARGGCEILPNYRNGDR